MGPTNGHIETPTLERETATILQRVTEEGGGYTFARMITAAREGDARAAEVAREIAWEQLHCGPWHSVQPIWREAYSMACLHVAKHHFSTGDFSETLKTLDLGLIMGGTLLRVDLESGVDKVMGVTAMEERENGNGNINGGLLFSSVDFNEDEVTRLLPMKSLSSKFVARRSELSLEGFLREYYLLGLPVIISDSMSHWPARARWNNLEYLKRVAGGRTVPVEVGKNYLCSDWKQELITFSQFLERIQSGNTSAVPTYLAQHPLFDQIKELRKDILVPDYCYAGGGELRSINAWFGPAETVTPLHHDPHHNILAQVVGKKYVRLYAASLSEELYPHSETMLCNSSQTT
ncbi:lysine-specific demethylase JMJ30 isoform X2 [Beta vulgaris subsp. vulgaris]|uniref:lysine-specific demethylase JMJ30 isoform X2 n=1 Tax=Beta vulgaris subsp. vulgaris TaxID=3555 RepID=UPI0020368065|nr:lysine-specific demethylase JMJ30 isoform X2 [Beta vulgaris subsp. vulgaris]